MIGVSFKLRVRLFSLFSFFFNFRNVSEPIVMIILIDCESQFTMMA